MSRSGGKRQARDPGKGYFHREAAFASASLRMTACQAANPPSMVRLAPVM